MAEQPVVAYVRSDARILAALLTGGRPEGHPVTLASLLMEMDYRNRLVPSFDEVSFGARRLVAGGFAGAVTSEAGGLQLKPSLAALALLHVPRRTGDFTADVALALDTRPYPELEAEDRSLGRLIELDQSEFDREAQNRQAWQQKLSPRGRALFESVFAEQLAANGVPVSGRKKRSRGPEGREAH